jgi:DNA invertase Pin-like site-specific DNA recombinase
MIYGYTRTSTDEQTTALQRAALERAGCEKIFEDKGISGTVRKRPALTRCLSALQAGDTLIVWKLDRLGRSLADLIAMLDDLSARGVRFQSLGVDPTALSWAAKSGLRAKSVIDSQHANFLQKVPFVKSGLW